MLIRSSCSGRHGCSGSRWRRITLSHAQDYRVRVDPVELFKADLGRVKKHMYFIRNMLSLADWRKR